MKKSLDERSRLSFPRKDWELIVRALESWIEPEKALPHSDILPIAEPLCTTLAAKLYAQNKTPQQNTDKLLYHLVTGRELKHIYYALMEYARFCRSDEDVFNQLRNIGQQLKKMWRKNYNEPGLNSWWF